MVWIYKGLFIVRDPAGDGYNIRTRKGEIIEEGCASVVAARLVIDELKEDD